VVFGELILNLFSKKFAWIGSNKFFVKMHLLLRQIKALSVTPRLLQFTVSILHNYCSASVWMSSSRSLSLQGSLLDSPQSTSPSFSDSGRIIRFFLLFFLFLLDFRLCSHFTSFIWQILLKFSICSSHHGWRGTEEQFLTLRSWSHHRWPKGVGQSREQWARKELKWVVAVSNWRTIAK